MTTEGVTTTPMTANSFDLRVPCTECEDALVVHLPVDEPTLATIADDNEWHLSVLSKHGCPVPGDVEVVTFGLLCPRCAVRVYNPALLAQASQARERRIKLRKS